MQNYMEMFKTLPMNCKNIIDVCNTIRPQEYYPYAYPGIDHGTGILKSEEQMNCYIAAYGKIHVEKCDEAFRNFPFSQLPEEIEIMDWGCGQGIASLRAFEILNRENPAGSVKRVTLIDASEASVNRAVFNWSKRTENSIECVPVIKHLCGRRYPLGNEVSRKYPVLIHIFSNILDILTIDLDHIQKKIKSLGGKQIIMCMGPMNRDSWRIDTFCSGFSPAEYFSKVDNISYGFFPGNDRRYSCKTKCFALDDNAGVCL